MTRLRLISLALSLLVTAACGGDSSTPATPTAPTPPTTTSTPQPARPPSVTFTPETTSPVGQAIAVFPASRGQQDGMVTIAIAGFNLPQFHLVRGELRWNAQLLEVDTWGKGDLLLHDGTDWTWYGGTNGDVSLYLGYPDSQPARSGSGEIILFRFKPKAGVTSGTTQLVWNDVSIRSAGFADRGPQRTYGGTITVTPQ